MLWVLNETPWRFLREQNYRRHSISGIEGPKLAIGLVDYNSHIHPYMCVRPSNSNQSLRLTESFVPTLQRHHQMVEQFEESRISLESKFLTDLSFLQTISSVFSRVLVHWMHCNRDSDLERICEARRLGISTGAHGLEWTPGAENQWLV